MGKPTNTKATVAVEIKVLESATSWRRHARMSLATDQFPERSTVISMFLTNYVVVTPEKGREIERWAHSLIGYMHTPPGEKKTVPAIEITYVQRGRGGGDE